MARDGEKMEIEIKADKLAKICARIYMEQSKDEKFSIDYGSKVEILKKAKDRMSQENILAEKYSKELGDRSSDLSKRFNIGEYSKHPDKGHEEHQGHQAYQSNIIKNIASNLAEEHILNGEDHINNMSDRSVMLIKNISHEQTRIDDIDKFGGFNGNLFKHDLLTDKIVSADNEIYKGFAKMKIKNSIVKAESISQLHGVNHNYHLEHQRQYEQMHNNHHEIYKSVHDHVASFNNSRFKSISSKTIEETSKQMHDHQKEYTKQREIQIEEHRQIQLQKTQSLEFK